MEGSGIGEVYRRSLRDPEGFWGEMAAAIDWYQPARQVFDANVGAYGQWFVGASCNTCFNAIDRHVAQGRGNQAAIIYDSPVTGTMRTITYSELLLEVSTFAGILKEFGVAQGDRVVLYMPMVPEAVVGMLACARIGAVHSVVFGGFAPRELAVRIDDARPKLVLSASCGIEGERIIPYKPLLDQALALSATKPAGCIILQRQAIEATMVAGRDHDWAQLRHAATKAQRTADCVALAATDPLYILYTSGTTSKPKGVVRDNGGHMVALHWSMKHIYAVEPGEVFWAASDIGWVVGHSYIVYGPLLSGCTSILYEGKPVGTPDAGAFWRVISEHDCVGLFTAPTSIRAIRKEDPEGLLRRQYDLAHLRTLFLGGERADPSTLDWAKNVLGVSAHDHWWQTETGWSITANPVGLGKLQVKRGAAGVAMPGYDVRIVDESGRESLPNILGSIVVKLPLPPSGLTTLWGQPEQFHQSYLLDFPGYYKTADAGFKDADGYLYVMGRTDDVINVAGHRLSTGAMEEVVASHEDVAECAVIGINSELKGQVPCGFIVLRAGTTRPSPEIERDVAVLMREKIGAIAALRTVVTVVRLPKTRSGKILRGTMKKIADGEPWTTPATIDDPTILEEIKKALEARGMDAARI